jgi:hypothetical protein
MAARCAPCLRCTVQLLSFGSFECGSFTCTDRILYGPLMPMMPVTAPFPNTKPKSLTHYPSSTQKGYLPGPRGQVWHQADG